jgi:N-methylhydantoinase B
MRGGATTAVGLTPHGVEGFDATLIGHGIEVPNSIGLFGGMPGSCAYHLLRPSNESPAALIERLHDALTVMSDSATTDLGAKPGNFRLRQGGVFAYVFQGGGGYGDPIRRDPESVLKDVRLGFLSRRWAGELYGVAIDPSGAVDQEATRLRRLAIRRARLGGGTPAADPARPAANKPVPDLVLDSNSHFRCSCGHDLGPASENWKTKAAARGVAPAACGPHIRLHAELRLREFCCPACATLLELEVHAHDEQPLWTVAIDT